MRRQPERLANETFDLLIIGGGVTGACVARDASLRGLKVAVVEKDDFAHATSAHNSKLIHGGLRYLKNFELGLVRESLKERRIWQRIAPHLVQPLPFLIPIYNGGFKARAQLTAGLTLYDGLSFDRGWLDDPGQRLKGHSWLNAKKAIAREPLVEGEGLDGAFLYYDAQMYAPERLALECVIDAVEHGTAAINHMAAESLLIRETRVEGATVRDAFSGARFDIRAKLTLLAAGPWADLFIERALGKPSVHRLLRSKGIHLIVPAMTRNTALTVAAEHSHFFVLPWRGHSILGTTDTNFLGLPDSVGVTESDIAGFIDYINKHLPSAHLTRDMVQHFYAGLRPLVDDGSKDTYGASRHAELIDHKDDGLEGLLSAVGGKWTTSRDLAEKVVNAVTEKLGGTYADCTTASAKLPGAPEGPFVDFVRRQSEEFESVRNIEHLSRLYGARLPKVLECAGNKPGMRAQLAPTGDIGAQILYAIEEEMAVTLEDVVMRRTGIGQLGDPGEAALDEVSWLMASELEWNAVRKQSELDALMTNFRTQPTRPVSAT
jgi:glycerol-3-phosphate dehydrogenase